MTDNFIEVPETLICGKNETAAIPYASIRRIKANKAVVAILAEGQGCFVRAAQFENNEFYQKFKQTLLANAGLESSRTIIA